MGISIDNDAIRIPSEQDIRLQVGKILGSAEFQTSERGRRFLSFIVDQTLAGRSDYLKAFNIAMEVFGRDTTFDAQSDPVVRIEAGNIRRALERYYLVAGGADDVVITIPKGAYVPSFDFGPMYGHGKITCRDRAVGSQQASAAQAATDGPSPSSPFAAQTPSFLKLSIATVGAIALIVFLEPFLNVLFFNGQRDDQAKQENAIRVETFGSGVSDARAAAFAQGLTDDVVSALAGHRELTVMTSPDGDTAGETGVNGAKYVVQGAVHIDADTLRVTVRLIRSADAAILWANSFDAALPAQHDPETIGLQVQFARQIADKIASPGVITP